ncbi:MAG: hypothetical protein ACK56W_21300 [Pirellula sp.]|nr:DUF1501 domain-containing protein [Pirellula sp.]
MKNHAYLRSFMQRNGLCRYQDDSGQFFHQSNGVGCRRFAGMGSRRQFLYAGWLGRAGRRSETSSSWKRYAKTKAKSVIQIYPKGGFAHMDSFDPKPDTSPGYIIKS